MKTLESLEIKKIKLSEKVNILITKKKELFSDVNITTPMSSKEKELTQKIAELYSEINQIILQKRNLLKK